MSCWLNPPPPAPPDPVEDLWGHARGCWEAFEAMFGTALQLVGEVNIRRRDHTIASGFLRGIEALVRRLLLVQAIHLIRANPAPPPKPPAPPARPGGSPAITPPRPLNHTPQPVELDTEDETQWTTGFSYGLGGLLQRDHPAARTRSSAGRLPREKLTPFCFAQTLALRMEALRRVISKPQTYIEGMAARLRRRLADDSALHPAPLGRLHSEAFRFLHWPLKHADALTGDVLAPSVHPPPTPDTS